MIVVGHDNDDLIVIGDAALMLIVKTNGTDDVLDVLREGRHLRDHVGRDGLWNLADDEAARVVPAGAADGTARLQCRKNFGEFHNVLF